MQQFHRITAKTRLLLGDWLRSSTAVWRMHAIALLLASFVKPHLETRLMMRALAYRRWPMAWLRRWLALWLTPSRGTIWRDRGIGWKRLEKRFQESKLIKSLLLKAPGPHGEKGVLYVAFEYNWLRLLEYHDIARLMKEYMLVAASSWSPPDYLAHWALAHIGSDPVFVQVSNPVDMDLLEGFPHNLQPVPIMASDWINPDCYQPRPHSEREIDLLMVAGWSPWKRHWLLFRALRKMRRGLRVVLIGQDMDGRSSADVLREAALFGVADRIEIICDASIEQVADYQCNSKASVILSAREGSCIVVAESLLADTPAAMPYDAHIGSRSYINEKTGVLLRPRTMAAQLEDMIDRSAQFEPRRWAEANIACGLTSQKLNGILREYALSTGMPWTRDILQMCRHPNAAYVNPTDLDDMAGAYSDLLERHHVFIAPYSRSVDKAP